MSNQDNEDSYLVQFSDFLIENQTGHSQEHWNYALQKVRKTLYTNSSASINSPFSHFLTYKKLDPRLVADVGKAAETYNFNAEPFAANDIFMFRQLRSEHLLIRVAHAINTREMKYTFSRLSRGVFLVQKDQPTEPITFPNTVTTFTFDMLFNDMMEQVQQQSTPTRLFVPFTYTLGVRFTNPYSNARDIVVRGNIPLWCQTLLITEYMRHVPVSPGTTLTGLLPFLKDIKFYFKQMTDSDPDPELYIMFERFAMELCAPQLVWQDQDKSGNTWKEARKDIVKSILFCNIQDEQAAYITTCANQWAISQGIPHA